MGPSAARSRCFTAFSMTNGRRVARRHWVHDKKVAVGDVSPFALTSMRGKPGTICHAGRSVAEPRHLASRLTRRTFAARFLRAAHSTSLRAGSSALVGMTMMKPKIPSALPLHSAATILSCASVTSLVAFSLPLVRILAYNPSVEAERDAPGCPEMTPNNVPDTSTSNRNAGVRLPTRSRCMDHSLNVGQPPINDKLEPEMDDRHSYLNKTGGLYI